MRIALRVRRQQGIHFSTVLYLNERYDLIIAADVALLCVCNMLGRSSAVFTCGSTRTWDSLPLCARPTIQHDRPSLSRCRCLGHPLARTWRFYAVPAFINITTMRLFELQSVNERMRNEKTKKVKRSSKRGKTLPFCRRRGSPNVHRIRA